MAIFSSSIGYNGLPLAAGGDYNHKTSYEVPHFNYTKNCYTKHSIATCGKRLLHTVFDCHSMIYLICFSVTVYFKEKGYVPVKLFFSGN